MRRLSFWRWFFTGNPASRDDIPTEETHPKTNLAGWRTLFDSWSFVGALASIALAYFLTDSVEAIGKSVIIPLAGMLTALCFAWAGNAIAILQTDELHDIASKRGEGFEDYAYSYQRSILVILVTLVAWGTASFGLFSSANGIRLSPSSYALAMYLTKAILLFLFSMTIRESWSVVNFTQASLVARYRLKDHRKQSRTESKNPN